MIRTKPADADSALPVAQAPSRASAALQAIQHCSALEPDWDLEGADPMDPAAAALAARLVEQVDLKARECAIAWHDPVVGPDPEGGIDLVWEADGRRALLMTRPSLSDRVDCVISETGGRPLRQAASFDEAVARALSRTTAPRSKSG